MYPDDRPLNVVVDIVGGRWRAHIIYLLLNRSMRYKDLENEIPQISQRMLNLDLRKLELKGIITRTVLAEVPIKVEYKLTPEGNELSMILHSLFSWEQKVKPELNHQPASERGEN